MYRHSIIVFFFIIFSSAIINAQGYKNAAGFRLSSKAAALNHALTAKHFFSPTLAIEGLFSFGNSFAIGALLQKHNSLGAEGVTWYYGGGLYGGFGESKFGAQGVIGIDYKWMNLPLNLSLDWKPEISISKDFGFEPAVIGFSARYVIN
ncbi:MAG TPA: hypothetical protein VM888_14170 [Chitinophagaceae bacterium]|nr:hypothetical protein [Chitinophagaceae bacterium]